MRFRNLTISILGALTTCFLIDSVRAASVQFYPLSNGTTCGIQLGSTSCPTIIYFGSMSGYESRTCTYTDPLPAAALVTSATFDVQAKRSSPYGGVPSFEVLLNGSSIGGPQTVTFFDNPTSCTTTSYVLSSGDYPNGIPGYSAGSTNSITIVTTGTAGIQIKELEIRLTLEYVMAPSFVELSDGSAETARRVIIHRYAGPAPVEGDGYTSLAQARLGTDGQIQVNVRVVNAANVPQSGVAVYFRATDPPASVPYGGSPHTDDNCGGPGRLSTRVSTTNSNGVASTILSVTDRYSGDNYQIETSTDPAIADDSSGYVCERACRRSGVITAWKRLYVETSQTFKKSSDLTARAEIGDTCIRLTSVSDFSAGDSIRLIHSPRLDHSGEAEVNEFHASDHVVTSVSTDRRNPFINVAPPLSHVYEPDPSAPATAKIPLGDAAGNLKYGTYYPHVQYLQAALTPAFVEVREFTADRVKEVPYVTSARATGCLSDCVTWTQARWIGRKWFEGALDTLLGNHVHLVEGSRTFTDTGTDTGDYFGLTFVGGPQAVNSSWVWYRTEETYVARKSSPFYNHDIATFDGETAVHEVAHQYDVNPSSISGHCSDLDYDSGNSCLMRDPIDASRADGTTKFHSADHPDSEYVTIRDRQEPIPQYRGGH